MTITIIIIAFLLLWFILIYNSFIKQQNIVKEAWSGIDVQLKRRYDLIPNVVNTVKGYGNYEQDLLKKITNLRTKSMLLISPGEKQKPESQLSGELKNLLAVVENYPDLKANRNFLDLQKQLAEVEDQIQYARRYYNGAVRDYNTKVESFPYNIVASFSDFQAADFFEITLATERENQKVGLSQK